MADIRKAIRDYLIADTSITALVATRIYWNKAPQNVIRPYVVYFITGDPDDRLEVGKDASEPIIEFDIISDVAATAITIDEAIRARIKEFTGTMGGLNIYRIKPLALRDFTNLEDDHEIQREFEVQYER